jgi:SNF2 family DNA or RNA helicase
MKTEPMDHQRVGRERLVAAQQYFALCAEQGTGKTWMLLDDAERQYKAGRINGLFVIAPKGVHTNWVRREIPTHMDVPVVAEAYFSGATKRLQQRLAKLLRHEEEALTVLTMNVDAVNTKNGFLYAKKFLQTYKCMMVVDESQRIKNPDAKRTQRILQLGGHAVSRRIATGTAITNSPADAFSQFEFLRSGLLGTTSYRAFVAEYTDLLPPEHPLVAEVQSRSRWGARAQPQIPRKDANGQPVYRNLDKLQQLMAPHAYRVLKKDCLDLPDKIYKTHYFELSPAQRRVYEAVAADMRYQRDDGDIDNFTALTLLNKLRQITSGFILLDHAAPDSDKRVSKPVELTEGKARLDALMEIVSDLDGQFIVWASFREELRRIADALRPLGVVEYHGAINAADREHAVDAFQRGDARVFVGHPQAGGVGLTLTAVETAIYFSCDFSLESRLQSEDRCHRIGTRKPVVYVDLAAVDTVDERIAEALQTKHAVARQILDGL